MVSPSACWQLARAYSVFATDGELKQLTLVRRRDHPVEGQAGSSRHTRKAVRKMLEMVTQPGGTATRDPGPPVTALLQDRHAHKPMVQRMRRIATFPSFVGFAPASNPRLVFA